MEVNLNTLKKDVRSRLHRIVSTTEFVKSKETHDSFVFIAGK